MSKLKQSVSRSVSNMVAALERCGVSYRVTQSKRSISCYVMIYKNGYCLLKLRFSKHAQSILTREKVNIERNIKCVEIGTHEEAHYTLNEWYKALEVVASVVKTVEVSDMCSQIMAEENIRRFRYSSGFTRVRHNVQRKAEGKGNSRPPVSTQSFLGLAHDFAKRFNLIILRHQSRGAKFFGLRRQTTSSVWIALHDYDPIDLPEGCPEECVIRYGDQKGSNYRSWQWEPVFELIARRLGLVDDLSGNRFQAFVRRSVERLWQDRKRMEAEKCTSNWSEGCK